MKAQYVGDIGDFGKVLLLKAVTSLGFKIGVNWVLTRNDEGDDGKHRDYPWYGIRHKANNPLYPPRIRPDNPRDCLTCCCDEETIRRMALLALKHKDKRKIEDLEKLLTEILPIAPVFFNKYFDGSSTRRDVNAAALEELRSANLVFLDPDNGIDLQDADSRKSPKHIYLDELAEYWACRKSILIYHHWGRPVGGIAPQMDRIKSELERFLTRSKLFLYPFRRGSGRTYFLIVHPDHSELMDKGKGEILRAVEPLTFTSKAWRSRAVPCSKKHVWQFD